MPHRTTPASGEARAAPSERLQLPRWPCLPPIHHELRHLTGFLHAAPAPAGWGIPVELEREPVLLIPGFLGGDSAMRALATFLAERGFQPWPSQISRNVDCSARAVERLIVRVRRIADDQGRPVGIVGHSRGGLFARVLARRCPELVSGVVTLAAPVRGELAVHPLVLAPILGLAALRAWGASGVLGLRCAGAGCCGRFRAELASPLPRSVPRVALYSRNDGIVDWRACLDDTGPNREVDAGHLAVLRDTTTHAVVSDALSSFFARRIRRGGDVAAAPAAEPTSVAALAA